MLRAPLVPLEREAAAAEGRQGLEEAEPEAEAAAAQEEQQTTPAKAAREKSETGLTYSCASQHERQGPR